MTKKILFIILLAAEGCLALLSLGQIFSWLSWPAFILIALFLGLVVFFALGWAKKKKAGECARRPKLGLAITLAAPTVAAVIVWVYVIVSLALML